jgi:protein SCO1
MRQSLIILPLLLVSLLFASCGSGTEHHSAYQCPMQCEGNKTYAKPGDCPVCGMELEGVETNH